ncbi:tRNA-binding protein [Desulfoscipio geothermicus]|uniref:tRNA-binding protein n=1 Tax=Desulfoscipio geothermicus DSM 3669 TaxID=1121426 RepID=A0A1I6D434_9FIRM|nr:tRNA-binding protein [Desulfoscipio geothermicus]SFR00141.1 tRNA-binding protein [Desulfoscipio geothermicus DSM 3669]
MATIDDFTKIDMRVGKVVAAEEFPEARKPAYKLTIDFGSLGLKKSSAQITHLYKPEELVGRLVVAVVNFPPRQIGPFISEVLVMGCDNDRGEVVLLQPDREVPLGQRIY